MFFSKSQVTVINFCTTFFFAAIDQLMVYGVIIIITLFQVEEIKIQNVIQVTYIR